MPRPRKPYTLSVSSSQAMYVLEKAVADRKLSPADVDRYAAQMYREISSLEEKLARLKDAVAGTATNRSDGGMPFPLGGRKKRGGDPPFPARNAGVDPPFPKKRKKRVSAARRASMKLQGQYLGLLTSLPKRDRATYQVLAKKDGREKAIAAMKKASGK